KSPETIEQAEMKNLTLALMPPEATGRVTLSVSYLPTGGSIEIYSGITRVIWNEPGHTSISWTANSYPSPLKMRGVGTSSASRDISINLSFVGDNDFAGVSCGDAVTVTVVNEDLSVNSSPEESEEITGTFIALNDDDDNENGASDLSDSHPITNENDLAKINIYPWPITLTDQNGVIIGKVKLTVSGSSSKVRIWAISGTDWTTLTGTTWSVVNSGTEWDSNQVPTNLYLEGIATSANVGDIQLVSELKVNNQFVCSDTVKVTVVKATFFEDPNEKYGFDNYTNRNTTKISWKSVRISDTDTANVTVTPTDAANYIYFAITNTSVATVLPGQASTSPEQITMTGTTKGETNIQANIQSVNGTNISTMGIATFYPITKTAALILVHEQNDDVPDIPFGGSITDPGTGAPISYTVCVSVGANGFRDSIPGGNDELVDPANPDTSAINTGPDGICDTVANNTVISSTDNTNATDVQNWLNRVYGQAVISWQVTHLGSQTVNFDLNRDTQIDVDHGWMSPEMLVISNTCGAITGYDHIIFLVNNPSDQSNGMSNFNQPFVFVHPDYSRLVPETISHELGHSAFGLWHTADIDTDCIMYYGFSFTNDKLRKGPVRLRVDEDLFRTQTTQAQWTDCNGATLP
ncbi:MAG: hypothetical protein PH343_08465, partial [Nitrospira sp.]|nr:hypothetical protein [Nitrospira sp.]